MKFIKKKVKIADGTIIDGFDYSGYTGTTLYVGDNGIWWVDFDEETLSKLPYEYIQECKTKDLDLESCCFAEKELIFL